MAAREEFVLIGPVCAGKTAVARRLADRLGIARVELDEIAPAYYLAAPGFEPEAYNHLMDHQGFVAAYRYLEPALAFAVEQLVEEHHDCVLDLGAGHSSFLDRELHRRVRRALAPFKRTVLILPSRDPELAIEILRRRSKAERGADWVHGDVDFIRHWVTDDQNRQLATQVMYTEGTTPDETAVRLLALT